MQVCKSCAEPLPRTLSIVRKRNAQVADVREVVDPYASAGGYIVVGGDFNQNPTATMATLGMYAGYGGYFDDVDRSGSCNDTLYNEPTHSLGKIDYTFVDHTRFSCYGGVVTRSDVSDHKPLRGAATLNY